MNQDGAHDNLKWTYRNSNAYREYMLSKSQS